MGVLEAERRQSRDLRRHQHDLGLQGDGVEVVERPNLDEDEEQDRDGEAALAQTGQRRTGGVRLPSGESASCHDQKS